MTDLLSAITALFVPGDRPDRFDKARSSGADVVILDLEDAVADAAKVRARSTVVDAVSSGYACIVRVSGAGPAHSADLEALAGVDRESLQGVMLAKAEGAAEVNRVAELGVPVIPLIESARGVDAVEEIAAVDSVARIAVGGHDLAADLAISARSRTMTMLASRIVLASRVAGIAAPWDSPSTVLDDPDVVVREARDARDDGFGGKLCIHPSQIAPVRTAFEPTRGEIAWAERVMAAGDGAVRLDGQMVDRPVVLRAARILSIRAGAPE